MNSQPEPPAPSTGAHPVVPTTHYEAARAFAVGDSMHGHPVIGLTVLYRWGMPAWMQVLQSVPLHLEAVTGARAASSTACAPGADAAPTILVIASMLLALSKESSQCTPQSN